VFYEESCHTANYYTVSGKKVMCKEHIIKPLIIIMITP